MLGHWWKFTTSDFRRSNRVEGGELVLWGVVAGGKDEERDLHERFREMNLRGEWFEPGRELLEFVLDETHVLVG